MDIHGHRGRTNDPLYRSRRTLSTGQDLLTDKQTTRLAALFADARHADVQASWGYYQQMIAAYRHPDRAAGKHAMAALIDAISSDVPAWAGVAESC